MWKGLKKKGATVHALGKWSSFSCSVKRKNKSNVIGMKTIWSESNIIKCKIDEINRKWKKTNRLEDKVCIVSENQKENTIEWDPIAKS